MIQKSGEKVRPAGINSVDSTEGKIRQKTAAPEEEGCASGSAMLMLAPVSAARPLTKSAAACKQFYINGFTTAMMTMMISSTVGTSLMAR